MEDQNLHYQHIMFFNFKKGKNASQTSNKVCFVYGKEAVLIFMCQKMVW